MRGSLLTRPPVLRQIAVPACCFGWQNRGQAGRFLKFAHLAEIQAGAGRQFDPAVVQAFTELFHSGRFDDIISAARQDTELVDFGDSLPVEPD